jgi:hypothetical protein
MLNSRITCNNGVLLNFPIPGQYSPTFEPDSKTYHNRNVGSVFLGGALVGRAARSSSPSGSATLQHETQHAHQAFFFFFGFFLLDVCVACLVGFDKSTSYICSLSASTGVAETIGAAFRVTTASPPNLRSVESSGLFALLGDGALAPSTADCLLADICPLDAGCPATDDCPTLLGCSTGDWLLTAEDCFARDDGCPP